MKSLSSRISKFIRGWLVSKWHLINDSHSFFCNLVTSVQSFTTIFSWQLLRAVPDKREFSMILGAINNYRIYSSISRVFQHEKSASPRVLAPFSRRGPWSGSCPAGPSPHQAGLQLQESLEPAMRLDRYPRAEVIVWVLVLEDRGSALPAAVSCASLPLADAGIEMFNLALGCGLSRGPGGELLLDPDDDEEEAGSGGTMSLSLLPTLNQVSRGPPAPTRRVKSGSRRKAASSESERSTDAG
uniref:Exoribonuclease phosphorolytic domain-containing protein n=1 Tax=Xenopus tropicalis TaxID=8364 RepID=A0A803K8I1_XENTR